MEEMMNLSKIKVRGLIGRELKMLKNKEGITLGGLTDMPVDKRDEALDRLIALACDVDPDDLTPGEKLDMYTRITAETYMTEADRKNFESPQSSALEIDSTTAANAEKQGSKGKGTARKSKKQTGSSRPNPFTK
jgi:hypothetical protein